MNRRFTFVCLTLVLVFATASAGAEVAGSFHIRNGITWSSTKAEVIEAETLNDPQQEPIGQGSMDSIEWVRVSNASAAGIVSDELLYLFAENKLVFIAYHYYRHQEEDFNVLQKALEAKYGEPLNLGADESLIMLNHLLGTDTTRDGLKGFTMWHIDENTRVFLSFVGTNEYFVAYLNLPVLRGMTNASIEEGGL